MSALGDRMVGSVAGAIVAIDGPRQRPHCKNARPHSAGAVHAIRVATCRAVRIARCVRQDVVAAVAGEGVERLGARMHNCVGLGSAAHLLLVCVVVL